MGASDLGNFPKERGDAPVSEDAQLDCDWRHPGDGARSVWRNRTNGKDVSLRPRAAGCDNAAAKDNWRALFVIKWRMDRKTRNVGVWLAPLAALRTPELYAFIALLGVGVLLFRALESLQSF